MKNLNVKPLALMMMGAALLTGCAATQKANEDYTAAKNDAESKYNGGAIKSSAAAINNDELNKNSNFGKTNRNWIEPKPLARVEEKVMLPDFFQKNVAMTMPGTVNAVEVLSEMQRSVNIKFNLASDIYDTNNGQGKIVTIAAANSNAAKTSPLLISDFVYRGTLEEALNLLGSKSNLSWKWNGKEVEIYRYETKTYNIAALAGSTNTSSNVDLKGDTGSSSAAGSGGGGGGAPVAGAGSSTVSRKATLTTWDEVRTFILAQLSQNGSMAVLESAGAVTIKDIPGVHKRVEKSIGDLNNLLSKQIYLNIEIYAVAKSDSDDAGLDLNKLLWGNADMSLTGIGGGGKIGNTFNIGILKGPFSGSNVMAKALSSVGKTSIVNQFSVTTLNGQPTPIASNKKTSYLASTKVTAATDKSGAITELVAGEISAGINLNVTPKIEPNGNILLEYAMNLSDVEDIVKYEAQDGSGSSIQLPISNLKSVLQRASLRSGETLVLSGFKQTNTKIAKSGVGSPSNILLGGSQSANASSQYLVITVTPYIANSNAYNK